MKILISGVGGNVGSILAEELSKYHNVTGIYRSRCYKGAAFRQIACDLKDCGKLSSDKYDVVIHVAAALAGTTADLVDNNILATEKFLEYAEKCNARRFIYCSTVSVYGEVDGILKNDSDMVNPSVYGMTKAIAEKLVEESKLPEKLVLRLPRMLGAHMEMDVPNAGLVKMIRQLFKNEQVHCYIPETAYNCYLYVKELTKFILRIIKVEKWPNYDEVNLASGRGELNMREILLCLKEGFGSTSDILEERMEDAKPKCALIDISKAVEMGYEVGNERKMLIEFEKEFKLINCKTQEA